MIKRRIWGSIALKWASLLSPWRGPQHHARRPDTIRLNKKAGGEAGGTSPPFCLPTEGGDIPPEGRQEGASFWLAPRKEPSAGATMPATPSISSTSERLALRDRYRDEA